MTEGHHMRNITETHKKYPDLGLFSTSMCGNTTMASDFPSQKCSKGDI